MEYLLCLVSRTGLHRRICLRSRTPGSKKLQRNRFVDRRLILVFKSGPVPRWHERLSNVVFSHIDPSAVDDTLFKGIIVALGGIDSGCDSLVEFMHGWLERIRVVLQAVGQRLS